MPTCQASEASRGSSWGAASPALRSAYAIRRNACVGAEADETANTFGDRGSETTVGMGNTDPRDFGVLWRLDPGRVEHHQLNGE